jgi:excisionase family DNA binding protein
MENAKYITIKELSTYLGVSNQTVRRALERGEMEYIHIGCNIRIDKRSAEKWIIQHTRGIQDNETEE